MEKLHLTFGSPSVLTNITTRNTDKPFFYFVDNNNHQQYALITIDLNSTFFKSNLNFKILNGQLNNNIDSLWFFNYFSLDIREQETYLSKLKIIPTDSLSFLCCQSFDSDFKFLIISNWSNEKNYKTWQNANNFVLTKTDSFNSLYSQKKELISLTLTYPNIGEIIMDSKKTGFSNIQRLDSEIIVDLKYATIDNFTHQIIYDFKTAIARTGTANKLVVASRIVKEKGYFLKVWDAYRPVRAQKKLFEVYPDPTFVAEPNPNFSHQKGVTFDLTLVDKNRKNVLMQSDFDDFSEKANRNFVRSNEEETNYQILNQAMIKAGFVGYSEEWWDYRDSEMDFYPPLDANPNDYC